MEFSSSDASGPREEPEPEPEPGADIESVIGHLPAFPLRSQIRQRRREKVSIVKDSMYVG